MLIESIAYTLINVYSPTKDNPVGHKYFLNTLKELIESHGDENIIIGGDFNICLDPKIDKKSGNIEKISSCAENLLAICDEYSLIDLWSVKNLDKHQYTRRENSRKGLVHSRLDYWLTSISITY